MLAVAIVVRISRVASLQTKLIRAHETERLIREAKNNSKAKYELVPLDDLLVRVVVSIVARECVREEQASEGVSSLQNIVSLTLSILYVRPAYPVSSVRVHLSSIVVGSDVNQILLDVSSYLWHAS